MKRLYTLLFCVIFLALSLTVFAGETEEKPSVKPYGYIKLDALYETGRSSHGNFAFWATDPGDNDGLFHMTANQTRLGLAITGFSFGKFKVTGKVEVDFYGGGAENKAFNYMRHAFLQVSDGSFTIIAGQTWDLICPLNPATLNYPVAWGAGNIGYRRPQLRLRKTVKTGKNLFTIEAGLFRTIAGDYDGDGVEDGTAAGFPTIQGRIAGKFAFGGSGYLQLGVSGHYGKSSGDVEFTSNSLNMDLMLVFSPKFKIVAEYFSGKNLGVFLGGIIQNVNVASAEEIKAKGFFVNAVADLTKKVRLSLGYSMDDPDDATLAAGSRSKNTSVFGNVLITLSKSVKTGFEVANIATDYLGLVDQKTTRFQHSWILSF